MKLGKKLKRMLSRSVAQAVPGYEGLRRRFWRSDLGHETPRDLSPELAKLAPYVRDYTVLRRRVWLPYVMNGVYPRIETQSVNTDGYGFRYAIDDEGRRLSPETGCNGAVSLLLGGSTPFGVGATSDATTIPSLLAIERGEPWFNLSVRGFTLAQNLVQTLFFLPRIGEVRQMVLFAGYNDIKHFFVTPIFPKLYGSFFDWMRYFSTLNPQFFKGRKKIFFPESFRLLFEPVEDPSLDHQAFRESLRNTLGAWKLIAGAKGARLAFVLQPVLGWMERDLAPEEERLLILRKQGGAKASRRQSVSDAYKQWYGAFLKAACRDLSIDFMDMNETYNSTTNAQRWLFIDNCHFTDEGSREAARLVGEVLGGPVST